jgi:hypothetical protein
MRMIRQYISLTRKRRVATVLRLRVRLMWSHWSATKNVRWRIRLCRNGGTHYVRPTSHCWIDFDRQQSLVNISLSYSSFRVAPCARRVYPIILNTAGFAPGAENRRPG